MFHLIIGSLTLEPMNIFVLHYICFIAIIKSNLLMSICQMAHLCLFNMLVLLFFHLIFTSLMSYILLLSKLTSYLFLKFVNLYLSMFIFCSIHVWYRMWKHKRWLVRVISVMVSMDWILLLLLHLKLIPFLMLFHFLQIIMFLVFLPMQSGTLD